jgi:ribosomal protein S12 methylthiotransferase accessory factor
MLLGAPDQAGRKLYREGTHRTDAPARTLARAKPHMEAMGITRIANLTGLDRLGIPVVGVFRPNSRSVSVAQGKGLHLDAAKASGLMEAVETFHAETIGIARIASLEELRRDQTVIDTNRLPRTPKGEVPPDHPIPWIRAEDWNTGEPLWVPYELVSTDYTLPLPSGTGYFQANTNGLASGNCALEAVLHGICELVERDATALWWQRSAEAKAASTIDLHNVADRACRWVLDRYAKAGVKVSVWDTTSDVEVASFLCAVYGHDDAPLPELGAGCHPSRDIALLRALTEAAQARTTVISGSRDDLPRRYYSSNSASARLRQFRALMDRDEAGVPVGEVPTFESDTIAEDVDHVVARLAMTGMSEIAVVDLTKIEFGIPVVRVVVPGLEGLFEDAYVPGARARSLAREA